MPTQPTGIRNKNYLNVKQGPDRWLDANGALSGTDSRGHAIFSDPAWGIRAGILTLRSYFFTHNRRTIAEILSRWAPATDTVGSLPGAPPNSPLKYSQFVAERMGISYNQKLTLFHEDRTIANIGQLRDLFMAMAAYEIGGNFKVPEAEFRAGLELVQPGILAEGSSPAAPQEVPSTSPAAQMVETFQIQASVGKGGANKKQDVTTVQQMLRNAAMLLADPSIDPGGIDGKIATNAKDSNTIRAIIAFQSRFFAKPDGLIEPEGRTWRELLIALSQSAVIPSPSGARSFPFASLPKKNWTEAPRSFGASRDGGQRAHAGCDLYFPEGTLIHAVADGTVTLGPYPFYAKTYALEIDHGDFIARYGEIQQEALVRKGDFVRAGQPIARVGHLVGISVPSDMLHFEMYSKKAHGSLTVPAAQSLFSPEGKPYLRRKDLIDPTPHLDQWKDHLPEVAPAFPAAPDPKVPAPEAPLFIEKPASGLPKNIPAQGFTLHLKRIRQELRSGMGYARTIGEYQAYWNGQPIPDLSGQMVERGGPGDNTKKIGDEYDRRIAAGTYRLSIHDGSSYKTYSYKVSDDPKKIPKPGLLLKDTNERTYILIHPGNNYLSSIGCLNPASGLQDAKSKIKFTDSRDRVIAILEAMKQKMGATFPKAGVIPNAYILIEGEPS